MNSIFRKPDGKVDWVGVILLIVAVGFYLALIIIHS